MDSKFSLRPITPQDGPALAKLMDETPDTGMISAAAHFEMDAYQALKTAQGDFIGVAAENPGHAGFIGSCLARFGHCQFEGKLRPVALINSLDTHPDFRQQGVGSGMVKWLVERCRERFGAEGVIWALIQHGNTGSERTVGKHLKQFIGDRLSAAPIQTRRKPPAAVRNLTVRAAEAGEYAEVAEKLNAFYQDFNFYEPETAGSLADWCATTPFDTPFRHYLVVTDAGGNMLAGAGVTETYRVRTLHIRHMPGLLRFLNTFFRMVPTNGITRELVPGRFWFSEGQMEAAKYLFESIRWQWRDRADLVMMSVDSLNPLREVLDLKPWIPVTRFALVVDSPETMTMDRPVCY